MKPKSRSLRCDTKRFANPVLLFAVLLSASLIFAGCQKETVSNETDASFTQSAPNEGNVVNEYTGLLWQTQWELQQARAATARYRKIENAIKDGYVDINVVVPGMGHHYMKASNVDGHFDFRKPEILVYNRDENGHFELVAVEYAVPISASPNVAPEGFTGTDDVWNRNTGFGLWLLHAWVWAFNPEGVFNPTNPNVHLH